MSLEESLTSQIVEYMAKQLDVRTVEGLRLKGFEFKNRKELGDFIKANCSKEETMNTTTYSVKGEPFLVHTYPDYHTLPVTFSLGNFKYV